MTPTCIGKPVSPKLGCAWQHSLPQQHFQRFRNLQRQESYLSHTQWNYDHWIDTGSSISLDIDELLQNDCVLKTLSQMFRGRGTAQMRLKGKRRLIILVMAVLCHVMAQSPKKNWWAKNFSDWDSRPKNHKKPRKAWFSNIFIAKRMCRVVFEIVMRYRV